MNKLVKQQLIKKEQLHAAFYFQSILAQIERFNLMNESEIENIQIQLIQLLQRQTEYYTSGDSSSVRIETAQNILQSIYYTIGIYLKSFDDINDVLKLLKEKTLSELFIAGKNLIKIQFADAKQLFNIINKSRIITDNIAYNDTLQSGLPSFFSAYDINFAAHDTPASIDYPLSNDKMELVGIEYIDDYLHKLKSENDFCNCFDAHELHSLLGGYDKNSKELLINIFELVLTNATGSVLAGKNSSNLNIGHEDRLILNKKLSDMSKEQLDAVLNDTANQLCRELNISDITLQKTILTNVMYLSARIENALKNDRLENIFLSFRANNSKAVNRFEEGRKMNDAAFRKMSEKIRGCKNISDKIAIIKKEIGSMTDLIDILENYSIFDDEYIDIFKSLGDTELILLLKTIPVNEMDSNFSNTENNKEWQNSLILFFNEMLPSRRETLRELAENICLD